MFRRLKSLRAAAKAEALIVKYERKIADPGIYIRHEGIDSLGLSEMEYAGQ